MTSDQRGAQAPETIEEWLTLDPGLWPYVPPLDVVRAFLAADSNNVWRLGPGMLAGALETALEALEILETPPETPLKTALEALEALRDLETLETLETALEALETLKTSLETTLETSMETLEMTLKTLEVLKALDEADPTPLPPPGPTSDALVAHEPAPAHEEKEARP